MCEPILVSTCSYFDNMWNPITLVNLYSTLKKLTMNFILLVIVWLFYQEWPFCTFSLYWYIHCTSIILHWNFVKYNSNLKYCTYTMLYFRSIKRCFVNYVVDNVVIYVFCSCCCYFWFVMKVFDSKIIASFNSCNFVKGQMYWGCVNPSQKLRQARRWHFVFVLRIRRI